MISYGIILRLERQKSPAKKQVIFSLKMLNGEMIAAGLEGIGFSVVNKIRFHAMGNMNFGLQMICQTLIRNADFSQRRFNMAGGLGQLLNKSRGDNGLFPAAAFRMLADAQHLME